MQTDKYTKLIEDLKKAKTAAEIVAEKTADNGTCNFDELYIRLPRWNEKQTIDAVKSIGLSCFTENCFGKKAFFIGNPVHAMADRRTEQAEAMEKVMKDLGYKTGVWYQMD